MKASWTSTRGEPRSGGGREWTSAIAALRPGWAGKPATRELSGLAGTPVGDAPDMLSPRIYAGELAADVRGRQVSASQDSVRDIRNGCDDPYKDRASPAISQLCHQVDAQPRFAAQVHGPA